jgi:outer membrane protein
MNKFLVIIALFAVTPLAAQTNQGSFLVGGNAFANFSKTKTKAEVIKYSSFSVSPRAGFFVLDNFCIGIATPLSISNTKNSTDTFEDLNSKSASIGVGPFLRYYFPVSKLYIVTELGYAINRVETTYDAIDFIDGGVIQEESKTTTREFQSAAGLALSISDHVMLEFLLNYRNLDYDYKNDGYEQAYKSDGFYLSVGFQIYLPKAKSQ